MVYTIFKELGDLLYLEEFEKEDVESKLIEKLLFKKNKIKILYNKIGYNSFHEKLSIDKSLTIKDLKLNLSKKIELETNQFRIFRGKNEDNYEFRNLNESLLEFVDGSTIFIKKGIILF
jgi:hypothetical protein